MQTWLIILGILLVLLAFGYLSWRMYITPARKPAQPQTTEPFYELPATYGEDEIIAMVKDPYWLFTYWEITNAKKEEFRRRFGHNAWELSAPFLRVYDLTGMGLAVTLDTPYMDIPINDYASNWYIHVGKPNHTFCIDLGRRLPDGMFVTLLRSNVVTTPSDRVSEIIDPLWPPLEAVWRAIERSPLYRKELAAFQPIGVGSPAPFAGVASEILLRRKE